MCDKRQNEKWGDYAKRMNYTYGRCVEANLMEIYGDITMLDKFCNKKWCMELEYAELRQLRLKNQALETTLQGEHIEYFKLEQKNKELQEEVETLEDKICDLKDDVETLEEGNNTIIEELQENNNFLIEERDNNELERCKGCGWGSHLPESHIMKAGNCGCKILELEYKITIDEDGEIQSEKYDILQEVKDLRQEVVELEQEKIKLENEKDEIDEEKEELNTNVNDIKCLWYELNNKMSEVMERNWCPPAHLIKD